MPVTTRRSSQRLERTPTQSARASVAATPSSAPPSAQPPASRPPSSNAPAPTSQPAPNHPNQSYDRVHATRQTWPAISAPPTTAPAVSRAAPSNRDPSARHSAPRTRNAARRTDDTAQQQPPLPRNVQHANSQRQTHRQRMAQSAQPHPRMQQQQQQQQQQQSHPVPTHSQSLPNQVAAQAQSHQQVQTDSMTQSPSNTRQSAQQPQHGQSLPASQPTPAAQPHPASQQPQQAHGFTAATGTHAPRVFSNPAPLQQIPVGMPPMQMQQVEPQVSQHLPTSQMQHRLPHHMAQGAPPQQQQSQHSTQPQSAPAGPQHAQPSPEQANPQYVQNRQMRMQQQPYRLEPNAAVVPDPTFSAVKVEYERYPQPHVKDAQQDHRVHEVQQPHPVFNSQLPPVSQHQHTVPQDATGAVHGGQMYMQMHGGLQTLQNVQQGVQHVQGVQNVQYANQYPNQGLFDQLNMNTQGVPMSGVNPQQQVDRQQHPHLQQMQSHQGVQVVAKGAVVQDPQQVYDQSQQQMLHRPAMQPQHVQHDMQGHPGAQPQHMQQHVQHQLYQPIEQQQTAQHLVLNAAGSIVQSGPPQQQQMMHNQQAPMPHGHVPQQEAHFDQHGYQNTHPSQMNNVNAVGVHPQNDASRKNVPGTSQQELLMWGSNQGARVVAQGNMQQQVPADINTGVAPGTLMTSSSFAPSQLFESMGMSDMRQQQMPNGVPQMQQPVVPKMEAVPQGAQNLMPNVRKMPAGTSPRKRRHVDTTTTTAPIVNSSGRLFACSCCGQEFAQKRDRDAHVKNMHERSFSCDKCSARFKTKSDANRHIRIVHDRVRPYQCDSCPSMFSERNKLRRHRETVHEKLRPYVCPVCSSRFGELGNLRQHTGSVHPGEPLDNAQIRTRVTSTQIQQS